MECSFYAHKRIRKPRIVFDLSNDNEIQILRMNEGKYYSVVYGAKPSLDRVAIQYPVVLSSRKSLASCDKKFDVDEKIRTILLANLISNDRNPRNRANKTYSIAK